MFLAFLAWRRLRPTWMLALAGVILGGLWVAQYYGPQAMPDLWVAFSALAAVGLLLRVTDRYQLTDAESSADSRAADSRAPPRGARSPGWPAVSRPPRSSGPATPSSWPQRWRPLLRRYGSGGTGRLWPPSWPAWPQAPPSGSSRRTCGAAARSPGCMPLALPVVVTLGVLAARRAGRLGSLLLPAACGICLAVQYLFLINYAAPRFLLPAYALLSIPVADALAWLVTGVRAENRPLTRVIMVVGLAAQLAVQHAVLDHEVAGTVVYHDDYSRIVADLRHLGIRPPCLIKGQQDIPIAFYAGCASAPSPAAVIRSGRGASRIAVLEYPRAHPPGYARSWQFHHLPGTRILTLVGYLAPS